jgi:hypothetical protein
MSRNGVRFPIRWQIPEGRVGNDPRIPRATLCMVPSATAATGCRTLDLLHIATAQMCGASTFVTGDSRQAKAARLCGMDVVEIR